MPPTDPLSTTTGPDPDMAAYLAERTKAQPAQQSGPDPDMAAYLEARKKGFVPSAPEQPSPATPRQGIGSRSTLTAIANGDTVNPAFLANQLPIKVMPQSTTSMGRGQQGPILTTEPGSNVHAPSMMNILPRLVIGAANARLSGIPGALFPDEFGQQALQNYPTGSGTADLVTDVVAGAAGGYGAYKNISSAFGRMGVANPLANAALTFPTMQLPEEISQTVQGNQSGGELAEHEGIAAVVGPLMEGASSVIGKSTLPTAAKAIAHPVAQASVLASQPLAEAELSGKPVDWKNVDTQGVMGLVMGGAAALGGHAAPEHAPSPQADFIQKMTPYAERASQATGLPTEFIVGQWAHESNFGQSKVAKQTGNLAGIKTEQGASSGALQYKGYDNPNAFTNDYIRTINHDRYADARSIAADGGSAKDIADALQRGGYAEDKNYGSKVARRVRQVTPNISQQKNQEVPNATQTGNVEQNGQQQYQGTEQGTASSEDAAEVRPQESAPDRRSDSGVPEGQVQQTAQTPTDVSSEVTNEQTGIQIDQPVLQGGRESVSGGNFEGSDRAQYRDLNEGISGNTEDRENNTEGHGPRSFDFNSDSRGESLRQGTQGANEAPSRSDDELSNAVQVAEGSSTFGGGTSGEGRDQAIEGVHFGERPTLAEIARGDKTSIESPTGNQYDGHYAVVDLSEITPSNDPRSFSAHEDYPPQVQDRDYKNSATEQAKVIRNGNDLKPSMLVNDSPVSDVGPPIVDSKGRVVGGNGRTMSMARSFETDGTAKTDYKETLVRKASQFGIDPEAIRAEKNPVLVRVLPDVELKSDQPSAALVGELNLSQTTEKDATTKAIAAGRSLTPEQHEAIGNILEKHEELGDAFSDPSTSKQLVRALERGNIITNENRPRYVEDTNKGPMLSDAGKDYVTDILTSRVIPDVDLARSTPPAVKQKIAKAALPLAQAGRYEGWSLEGPIREAIEDINAQKASGMNNADWRSQISFDREPISRQGEAMRNLLADSRQKPLREFAEKYAAEARADKGEQSSEMFEKPVRNPAETLTRLSEAATGKPVETKAKYNRADAVRELETNTHLSPEQRTMGIGLVDAVAKQLARRAGGRVEDFYGAALRGITSEAAPESGLRQLGIDVGDNQGDLFKANNTDDALAASLSGISGEDAKKISKWKPMVSAAKSREGKYENSIEFRKAKAAQSEEKTARTAYARESAQSYGLDPKQINIDEFFKSHPEAEFGFLRQQQQNTVEALRNKYQDVKQGHGFIGRILDKYPDALSDPLVQKVAKYHRQMLKLPEVPVRAAVRFEGDLALGRNHGEAFDAAANANLGDAQAIRSSWESRESTARNVRPEDEGFFTNHGRYVSREEAATLIGKTGKLYSEETAQRMRGPEPVLYQQEKGAVSFDDSGKALIHFFKTADFSTLVHELGHVFRRNLDPDLLQRAEGALGVKDGIWTRDHEEQFAEGFETYLSEGKAPNAELQPMFDKFKQWLGDIYSSIKNSILGADIHPELRAVFEDMLGAEREKENTKTPIGRATLSSEPISDPGGIHDGQSEKSLAELGAALDKQARENEAREAMRGQVLNSALPGLGQKEITTITRKLAAIPKEIAEGGKGLTGKAKEWGYQLTKAFNPTANASSIGADNAAHTLGQIHKSEVVAALSMKEMESGLNKTYSQGELVKQIMRMESGESSGNSAVDAFRREDVKDQRRFANKVFAYGLGLKAQRINYIEHVWRVLPGSMKERFADESEAASRQKSRTSMLGPKSMLKQRSYETIAEGLADGGELASNNYITLSMLSKAGRAKLEYGIDHSENMKANGTAIFVPHDVTEQLPSHMEPFAWKNEELPGGYEKLNPQDINTVFFLRTEMGESGANGEALGGPINTLDEIQKDSGDWYLERGTYDLLRNHMAKDWLRESVPSFLGLKQFYTALQLAGPFHAMWSAGSAIDFAGARAILNLTEAGRNALSGNLGEARENVIAAAKELPGVIPGVQAVKDIRIGKTLRGFLRAGDTGKEGFINSAQGKFLLSKLNEAAPGLDLDHTVDLMFDGGIFTVSDPSFLGNHVTAMQEAWNQNRTLSAICHLPQAAAEMIATPIMAHQVPMEKAGLFVQNYGQQWLARRGEIEAGTLTEQTLARDVGRQIENVMGQVQYDMNFFPRVVKSVSQFMLTAPGWKLGTVRQVLGAAVGQGKEISRAVKAGEAPHLEARMAWAAATLVRTVAQSIVITGMASLYNTGTWQMPTGNLLNWIYPVYKRDPDGTEHHWSPLSYAADFVGIDINPIDYITNSLSPLISRTVESFFTNKKYGGEQVYDRNDPWLKQQADKLGNVLLPDNIVTSNMLRATKTNHLDWSNPFSPQNLSLIALTASGVARPAPGYIEENPAEQEMTAFGREHNSTVGMTPEQVAKRNARNDYEEAIRTGDTSTEQKIATSGALSKQELTSASKLALIPRDASKFNKLPLDEKLRVYNLMDPKSRSMFAGYDKDGNVRTVRSRLYDSFQTELQRGAISAEEGPAKYAAIKNALRLPFDTLPVGISRSGQ